MLDTLEEISLAVALVSTIVTVLLTVYIYRLGKKQDIILQHTLEALNRKIDLEKELVSSVELIRSVSVRLAAGREKDAEETLRMVKDAVIATETENVAREIAGERSDIDGKGS